LSFQTHQLNIANGAFHAGRRIARDAGIDDRLLIAYPLGGRHRTQLVTAAVRHSIGGSFLRMSDKIFLATGALYLETDPVLPLDVDGEIRGRTPVHVRIVPNALRVLVPDDFVDS
jgi:diacylglycerol kinase family enzyme